MSKHNYRTCDVCGDRIGHLTHVRLKRFLLHGWVLRLCDWGIITPDGDSGWRKSRLDVCKECWADVTAEIRERKAERDR